MAGVHYAVDMITILKVQRIVALLFYLHISKNYCTYDGGLFSFQKFAKVADLGVIWQK